MHNFCVFSEVRDGGIMAWKWNKVFEMECGTRFEKIRSDSWKEGKEKLRISWRR